MGPKFGIFNVHLNMGFEEQSLNLALMNEKEGGTVVVTTNPVDDRIEDPTSKSNIETTLLLSHHA